MLHALTVYAPKARVRTLLMVGTPWEIEYHLSRLKRNNGSATIIREVNPVDSVPPIGVDVD